MIDAFIEGATIASHRVEVIDICKKSIKGCLACEYCHTKGNGICIQKDDRQEVYRLLALVDLMANADLGGQTVLYMMDALICAPSEGIELIQITK